MSRNANPQAMIRSGEIRLRASDIRAESCRVNESQKENTNGLREVASRIKRFTQSLRDPQGKDKNETEETET